jgi:hypothetical protein
MATLQTMTVTLKDGSVAVINASDFDSSAHTVSTAKKKPVAPPPRKKPINRGAR